MNLRPVVVDTDVLIDASRGYPSAIDFLDQFAGYVSVSVMTAVEIWAGVKGSREEYFVEAFLDANGLVDVRYDIAVRACKMIHKYGRSHGVGAADAVIAATAESLNATLITLNKKHFPMLKNVFVPYKK